MREMCDQRISLLVTEKVKHELEQLAKDNGRTVNGLLRRIIALYADADNRAA